MSNGDLGAVEWSNSGRPFDYTALAIDVADQMRDCADRILIADGFRSGKVR
jgi:hypothetical protein